MARVDRELTLRGVTTAGARAHFVSALALTLPDGSERIFEGRVFGTLAWPPRGPKGFGYDPMFQPDGHALTFGEMTAEEKHGLPPKGAGLSHRRARLHRAGEGGVRGESGASIELFPLSRLCPSCPGLSRASTKVSPCCGVQVVDARHKAGHDGEDSALQPFGAHPPPSAIRLTSPAKGPDWAPSKGGPTKGLRGCTVPHRNPASDP